MLQYIDTSVIKDKTEEKIRTARCNFQSSSATRSTSLPAKGRFEFSLQDVAAKKEVDISIFAHPDPEKMSQEYQEKDETFSIILQHREK